MIHAAVAQVPGVAEQQMEIVGYIQAADLESFIRQISEALEEDQNQPG